ncbi:hypothetical protein HYW32_00365 [Candidatus Berkelbacteria bacterium]|nr:hypothetical protein [Candidatus Berkelbacteria bacterium]
MKRIESFLATIEKVFANMDTRTFWPLNGGQIGAYFEVAEALDIYKRLMALRTRKDLAAIAKLLPPPDILRNFIENNGLIGLKVAHQLKLADIDSRARTDYLLFLFDLLAEKTQNDIFCHDGKNLLLTQGEIDHLLATMRWQVVEKTLEQKTLANLIITASQFAYSLYYDIYMVGGFYLHGPYDVARRFGRNAILIIRDYHNLKPHLLWPELRLDLNSLRLFTIYRGLDFKINFANHPDSTTSVADKLIAYYAELDSRRLKHDDIPALTDKLEQLATIQARTIMAWSDHKKVKKGAEIAYYLFRNFRIATGTDWSPPIDVKQTIDSFGDEFIKRFHYFEAPPGLAHWRKIFDPRIDYY